MESNPQNDHQNPENWKWGIFYFNPDDSRLLVPKRIPFFGFTLNFANKYLGIILLALIAFILLLKQI